MSISAAVCAVVFSTWMLITVIGQFPQLRLSRFLKRHDYFAAIPAWTFFAPNPAVQDFTLLFRDKDYGGQLSQWKVFAYCPPRPTIRWLWNPDKRRSKVIHDMATVWLLIAESDPSTDAFMLSVPYLCLLHQASVAPRSKSAIATQIAIAVVHIHHKDKPVEILATSRFHKL